MYNHLQRPETQMMEKTQRFNHHWSTKKRKWLWLLPVSDEKIHLALWYFVINCLLMRVNDSTYCSRSDRPSGQCDCRKTPWHHMTNPDLLWASCRKSKTHKGLQLCNTFFPLSVSLVGGGSWDYDWTVLSLKKIWYFHTCSLTVKNVYFSESVCVWRDCAYLYCAFNLPLYP